MDNCFLHSVDVFKQECDDGLCELLKHTPFVICVIRISVSMHSINRNAGQGSSGTAFIGQELMINAAQSSETMENQGNMLEEDH